MPKRLAGKVSVITGTGGSIGAAAALTFAREGALVVGTGQRAGSSDEAIAAVRDAGGTMVAFEPCDLSKGGMASPQIEPRRHRQYGLAQRLAEFQVAALTSALDIQGGHRRNDPAACGRGPRTRHSGEFDFAGVVETNQTREQLKDPEWAASMLGKTLLGRLCRPEEIANVALFLTSDESSYVNAIDVVVDGGMKSW